MPKKIEHLTEEWKDKIRIGNLGVKRSEETRSRISLSKKGKTTWMKGKKHSEESKQKMRENYAGGYETRFKVGEEIPKERIRKRVESLKKNAIINPNYGMKGKHHSKEFKDKYKEMRKNWITPKKDTSIELKIQNYLKQLNIEFLTHQYIKDIEHGYQCDILIPVQEGIYKKTIIECFGTYWHNYPLSREIDIKRCIELREKGYRVLVFWENEIKVMELNDLQEVLIK